MKSIFHFKIMTFKRCFYPKLVAFLPFIQGLTVLLDYIIQTWLAKTLTVK